MTLPSAIDEAGLRMLDSIREIFDIIDFEFESVGFNLIEFKNFEELTHAIKDGKCPVACVTKKYFSLICIPRTKMETMLWLQLE